VHVLIFTSAGSDMKQCVSITVRHQFDWCIGGSVTSSMTLKAGGLCLAATVVFASDKRFKINQTIG
jgi:hypothetical protein